MTLPLSILDLAPVCPGQTVGDSLAASVTLAQRAEQWGYRRVWYAEHHNNSTIASSAPAVLIAHVATFTHAVRLGAGGVMLPNHAPLTVAEQFGTLDALHPGRIDLGLGRAPGTDQAAWHRSAMPRRVPPNRATSREVRGADRAACDAVVDHSESNLAP
jgi:luciferase family oxidoreductase group 1